MLAPCLTKYKFVNCVVFFHNLHCIALPISWWCFIAGVAKCAKNQWTEILTNVLWLMCNSPFNHCCAWWIGGDTNMTLSLVYLGSSINLQHWAFYLFIYFLLRKSFGYKWSQVQVTEFISSYELWIHKIYSLL